MEMCTWISWVHPELVPHGLSQDRVSRSIVVPVDNVVSDNLIGPFVHERVADDGSSSCTTHMHCLHPCNVWAGCVQSVQQSPTIEQSMNGFAWSFGTNEKACIWLLNICRP